MIVGGWEYVWAAYGIAWAGLTLYGVSLFMRTRAARARARLPEGGS
jgi:hypothetical protein